jgi:signal transduction histidine kinase
MGFFLAILQLQRSKPHFTVNVLSLIFSVLTFGLLAILYALFGWSGTMPMIFGVAFLFLAVIVLNNTGYDTLGRFIFCLVPVWLSLIITIHGKLENPQQSYIIYFDSRYILLATTILPGIVFDFKERLSLAVCMGSSFLALMLFDPIHNWLGVGYYQRGFNVESYYYINYIMFIAFAALASGIVILKWKHHVAQEQAEKLLQQNVAVNSQLLERNNELRNISHEMEAQNEELVQQHEEILTSAEAINKANETIGQQARQLELYNKELQKLVEEKSGDLLKTNEELIQSNNELRQFSFSVSHNLRGPVARLLGLTNLMQVDQSPEHVQNTIKFIEQSAKELDELLHDLSNIIDIRNELYRVREKVFIKDSWEQCLKLIGEDSLKNVQLEVNFKEPHVFGIRPMILSALFNLVSNSIKYRAERPLHIKVSSYALPPDRLVIEVTDNGLGIDLNRQGDNIFKLYKRFHQHVPGKGLGLYLVRTQMEINGGRVEVDSELNKGTTFRLIFPVPTDVDKQVFFENDSAQLYYDANINNTVIIWKKNVTSPEYRAAFECVLQTIKKYNTRGWIADLRNQGVITTDDQQWFVNNVLTMAAANGLSRIATVGFDDPVRKEYYNRMIAKTAEFGITLRVFHDLEQAVAWMKSMHD